MTKWSRRDFLKAAGATIATFAAKDVLALDLLAPVADPLGAYPYRGWETLYRDQYTFDYTGRSTHSMNCTGSCTWKIYVKNGIAFKEEQYADYPPINSTLPTYNPRGCQKGANYLEYVYGPQRVKYPLIRTGARGEGKWRRASWDEAASLIASKITGNISANGPDSIFFYSAIPAKHFVTFAGGARLANLTGAVMCSFYDWYCDLPPGEPITWGEQTDSCEAADWVNSKYLILWGANLLETRIPDAHFMTEARMRGCKVVAIFPEYNPVSIHADIFVPVRPGTDGALGLAMANVIVDESLYDAAYVKQFTDFPFLVRTDNNKFLRESDVVSGGSPDKFYVWDTATGKAALVPGTWGDTNKTLALGLISPALEGTYNVSTVAGVKQVTTVFAKLKATLLASYSPSAMAGVTGVNANLITQIAREFAATKPGRIIEGAGTNHYFHNDLINRAQILLVALTGNVGKPGGGFDHYVGQEKIWPEHGFMNLAYPLTTAKQRFQNTTLWTYVHAGVTSDVDSVLPQPLSTYISQSVTNGWMPLYPEGTLTNGKTPKVLIIWGANYINQAKGYEKVVSDLLPKLDLIVDLNYRMDTSAFYADVVLPAASFYEKWDLNSTDLHSYIHPFTPVIPPLYESKTDWQIWQALAQALQNTGFSYNDTKFGLTRNFATLVSDFTANGAIAADKNACQNLLDNAEETAGVTMDQIVTQPHRFTQTSEVWTSDIKPGVAYYGFQRMTEHLRPLNTLAGRQQFYVDHDWFLEMGEQLPVHKAPIDADAYPLRWITPHGRWSIHSSWRDAKFQLRLQRGRPVVYLSPAEAAKRKLVDNDKVEIYNKNGSCIAHLYVSPRMPDGMAMMYHGWERTFFQKGGWQSLTTIRIKPTQLAGGYGQLKFKLNYWGPTGNQKDTRVEIRKSII